MIIAICLQKQNFSIYRLDKSGAGDWLVLLFSGKNKYYEGPVPKAGLSQDTQTEEQCVQRIAANREHQTSGALQLEYL